MKAVVWRALLAGFVSGILAGVSSPTWAFFDGPDDQTASQSSKPSEEQPAGTITPEEVARISGEIDQLIRARWEAEDVTPAPLSDDAEFLRRTHLHITGTIPPVSLVRSFLADESPDKRQKLVQDLLSSSGYVVNFTDFWQRVLLPEAETDQQVQFLSFGFQGWLRSHLRENTPFNVMVWELLTTQLDYSAEQNQQQLAYYRMQINSPAAFYQGKQVDPGNLAASTARMLLGIRMDCAQCHAHPFDTWSQEDFWEFAAFFSGLERQQQQNIYSPITEAQDKREITIPETEIVVQATFLDGSAPDWANTPYSSRKALANWVTSKNNPWFAKATANRMWGHFFGRGLIDPVDDFRADNPASHPEVLDLLAREFIAHDYDMKALIQIITATEAYQLTSRQTDESQGTPELFARMSVQGLNNTQLLAAYQLAVGNFQPYQPQQRAVVFNGNNPQGEFLEAFGDSVEPPTEKTTTILQALTMMNGPMVASATDLKESQTLAAVIDAPFLNSRQKIETLYLTALSRMPREEELASLLEYVESGGPKQDQAEALADIYWALLNSSEFMFNH